MARTFENPSNGYREEASGFFSWLWCFLFGPIYFLVNGNYRHAIASFLFAIVTFGASWLVYPFFVYGINRRHYLRKGWVDVSE